MRIPEKFEIGGQEIKVNYTDIDYTSENRFGWYDSVAEEITICKKVKNGEDKIVELSESQIENTFFHELMHVFQFHSKDEMSEEESSTYSAFLTQFFKSSGLKIV